MNATTPPVSCLLVDDHPALLDALSRVLSAAGVRIVGAAASAAKGLALLQRRPADVVLLDMRLPDMDGIELAQVIARSPVPAKTLLYSGHADAELAGQALAAGLNGMISKGSPLSEVVRAVHTVAAGRTYLDPLLGAQVALGAGGEGPELADRDVVLLQYVSRGLTDERIGEELHLSAETIRANVRRVVQSLQARNRTHAVALALRKGLID